MSVRVKVIHNTDGTMIYQDLELQIVPRTGDFLVIPVNNLGITYVVMYVIHYAGKCGFTEIRVREH